MTALSPDLAAVLSGHVEAMADAVASADVVGASPHQFGVTVPGLEWPARHPSPAATLDQAVTLGVEWVRFDLPWVATEQQAGVYTWGVFDDLVAQVVGRGLKPLLILDYNNPIHSGDPNPLRGISTAANRAAFVAWARAAVRHFRGRGVRSWEVWNEPNSAYFWAPNGSPTEYVALLQATYPAIKQEDPGSTVVGGVLANSFAPQMDPPSFLEEMYLAGAHGYFDVLSTHAYSSPRLPADDGYYTGWQLMAAPVWGLRDQMVANGDGGKSVWVTEFGAPTGGTDGNSQIVSEAHQAQQVAEAIRLWKSYPWAGHLFFHTLRDPADIPASDHERWFGLLRPNGSEKPAAAAVRAA